jgi:hypothetical protein
MGMMSHWKDNFMNFYLEGCFNICYVLDVKKYVEDEAVTRTG